MDKRAKQAVIGTIILLLTLIAVVTITLVNKYTPSEERVELSEYLSVPKGEAMVIMDDLIYEKNALFIDGVVYMDLTTITTYFNHRFYWDAIENYLIYTTPTEVIKVEVANNEYMVNKTKETVHYPIVKTVGEEVYVALEFVSKYSSMEFQTYEQPDRVVIQASFGDYLYVDVIKNTQIRIDKSIKSEIVYDVAVGEKLLLIDASGSNTTGFYEVMTKDGVKGFVRKKHVSESFYQTVESDYEALEYTSIHKDYKVNLVWHQVTNKESNQYMADLLGNAKGVTTISPTWYRVNSIDGTIASLASESYVEKAHSMGLEVWALVDNFDVNVSTYEVLAKTSSRERLVNELIAEAIKYKLDGINIDFEDLTLETGPHYIQFLRELSIKCRSNQIVLSVDSYVPYSYTKFYDREEQGKILDYVIIMGYDEYHTKSESAGSVASLGFVKEAITNILAMVPKEKVIMGIPFYTRLWKESTELGESVLTSEALGMSAIDKVLEENSVTPEWDEVTGQYYAEYESDGATYKVWLEEEKSIEEKIKLIHESDLAGVASWRLGFEKSGIWNVIQKYVN